MVDVFATLQEVVGGKVLDAKAAGADSFSFCSELLGKASDKSIRKTMVLNDVRGVVAIRMGDWKYIEGKATRPVDKARQKKFPKQVKQQLYNLKQDPEETKDVIDEFPEVAEKMQGALDRIRSLGSERMAVKERR